MEPIGIIKRYYDPDSLAYRILTAHGLLVAEKSLRIARQVNHLTPDTEFIREAAMLHDIGMFLTDEPEIGCHGHAPYVCHGYLGREILEHEGLFRHALVCERHVGAGITAREIAGKSLPLPVRDMLPLSMEEQIICVADKFFSKDPGMREKEKTIVEVRARMQLLGEDTLKRFNAMAAKFRV
jgi:uncharacterized protein